MIYIHKDTQELPTMLYFSEEPHIYKHLLTPAHALTDTTYTLHIKTHFNFMITFTQIFKLYKHTSHPTYTHPFTPYNNTHTPHIFTEHTPELPY